MVRFKKANMYVTSTRTGALVLTPAYETHTLLLTPSVWHAVTHLYQVHTDIFRAVKCCTN